MKGGKLVIRLPGAAGSSRRKLECGTCFVWEAERIGQAFQRFAIGYLAVAAFESADGLHADQRAVRKHLLRKAGLYAKLLEECRKLERCALPARRGGDSKRRIGRTAFGRLLIHDLSRRRIDRVNVTAGIADP